MRVTAATLASGSSVPSFRSSRRGKPFDSADVDDHSTMVVVIVVMVMVTVVAPVVIGLGRRREGKAADGDSSEDQCL